MIDKAMLIEEWVTRFPLALARMSPSQIVTAWEQYRTELHKNAKPEPGRPQSYDERLRQMSFATIDSKMLGVGLLAILPDNSIWRLKPESVDFKGVLPWN